MFILFFAWLLFVDNTEFKEYVGGATHENESNCTATANLVIDIHIWGGESLLVQHSLVEMMVIW
jgi:hypothetical protein